jgi:multiple sugar transport system permease protein
MSSEVVLEKPASAAELPTERGRGRWPFDPWHLLLFPLAIVMLFPLFWMVMTSLMTLPEAQRFPPTLIPEGIHWQNYPNALKAAPLGRYFVNTTIVTVAAVVSNLVFCSLAGYAFARIRFFGRELAFILILATLMVPFQVTMIPSFLIVKWIGENISPTIGVNSVGGLVASNLVSAFGVFMLRQFFRTLPRELEDAARIDGASRLGVLFKIVLPLSAPALATLAAITFLNTWNDFLWPLILISSDENRTIQLGLAAFQGAHQTQWTQLMAANVMSMIPMLLVFFAAQRYFVRSVAMSGLKQ